MVTTAMVVLLLCGAKASTRPSTLLSQQDARPSAPVIFSWSQAAGATCPDACVRTDPTRVGTEARHPRAAGVREGNPVAVCKRANFTSMELR